MTWPKMVVRRTRHKKPRHQLYQPGFNASNGCWLEGSWITLPEDEWEARKDEHARMYGQLGRTVRDQHYDGEAVPPDRMGDAQRQAWEHYSGSVHLDCRHVGSGQIGPVRVEMQGNRISAKVARWMLAHGWRILRFVRRPGGETVDQAEGREIPDELLADEGASEDAAVDPWRHVVDQNVREHDEIFEALVNPDYGDGMMGVMGALTTVLTQIPEAPQGFAMDMAFHQLVMQEEVIVHMAWNEARGGRDPYRTLEQERDRYAGMRRKLVEACGTPEAFDAAYRRARDAHNECARRNLDDSGGALYAYVLPEFHEDGTHEPWGPRDVPWGQGDP